MNEQLKNTSKQSNGGKVMAIRQRQEALKKYYENPNKCKYCHAIIEVNDSQKVSEVRKKTFCNQSCNAQQANKNRTYSKKPLSDIDMQYPVTNRRQTGVLPRELANKAKETLQFVTKEHLFKTCTTWQCARSTIQKHAVRVYKRTRLHEHCYRIGCTYSRYIDVAHIKPVAAFSGDALIGEINAPVNIMGLCKNHHWEYDHGDISISDIDLTNKNGASLIRTDSILIAGQVL